jgi:hypothetical protein
MTIETLKNLLGWLAIAGFLFWMMRRGGCGMMPVGLGRRSQRPEDGPPGRFRSALGKPVDPVCEMEVDPANAAGTRLANGETFSSVRRRVWMPST